VLLIGGDLNAVARVESACRSAGLGFRTGGLDGLAERLAVAPALVIVDLDDAGPAAIPALQSALASGALERERTVVFHSHVDEEAGRAATAAGLKALPRGRFWRELPDLVSSLEV
jgi:hypothetical protein